MLRELDDLNRLFYLGNNLNLVNDKHFSMLKNSFLVFKSHIILLNNNTSNANKNTQLPYETPNENLDRDINERQKKILEMFSNKETLKLAEMIELFPGIKSEKTVRNDLSYLIKLGKIVRRGNGPGSFYEIIR